MKEQNTNTTTKRTLHYYFWMYKKYKWYTLGVLISTPIVIFVRSILQPLILAEMIDVIASGMPAEELPVALLPRALFLIITYFVSNVFLEKFRVWCCWKMEILAMYEFGEITFDAICEQSMQFHNDRFSGSLVSQTNKFIGSFERFTDVMVWDAMPLVISMIFYTVVLAPSVPVFAVLLDLFFIIYVVVAGVTSKHMRKLSEKEASTGAKVTGQLSDSISNIMSVKSYSREKYERKRYDIFQDKWQKASFDFMKYTIKRDIIYGLINIGLTAAVIVFMLYGRMWFGLSIATLILIVNYSQQVLSSLWNVNHIFKNTMRAFGDAKEMTEILDLPDDVVDAPEAYDMKPKHSTVEFSHVDFRHADAKEDIFHDFNLKIKEGERIGLVGMSGSGKTTLTKLLLRFADVDGGEIRVDDDDIRKVTQKSLREYISYVPQETALFHRSIADNIAYAKPDATREEIIRAAKLANADEFIRKTTDGYDTMVGERGIKLSGGQRQRIAIARAILKNSPILVLDEATSALDSESEALIQDALQKLMKNRTSIVIAHRLSTVAELDRIVVLDDGKIIEEGPHAELIKKNGAYKKLWARQSGNFVSED